MMHSTCGYRKFEFFLGSLCFALGGRKLLQANSCSSRQELHDTHARFKTCKFKLSASVLSLPAKAV